VVVSPSREVIAHEIVADLEAALAKFAQVARTLTEAKQPSPTDLTAGELDRKATLRRQPES
jgi:hypothetical protein